VSSLQTVLQVGNGQIVQSDGGVDGRRQGRIRTGDGVLIVRPRLRLRGLESQCRRLVRLRL
jgi:hypothetical protein